MTVSGESHGKGNGTRYVFVVARFWSVATSRALESWYDMQAADGLGWTTAGSEFRGHWLAPVPHRRMRVRDSTPRDPSTICRLDTPPEAIGSG